MAKKNNLKTAVLVNKKVVITTLVLLLLISGSIVISSLISSDVPARLKLLATSKSYKTLKGWCVTKYLGIGGDGEHLTLAQCIARQNDDSPLTQWYAWCPDLDENTPRTKCDCNDSDIIKSLELNRIMALRDPLIESGNDGQTNAQETLDLFQFSLPVRLSCSCPIWTTLFVPNNPDSIMTFGSPPMIVDDSVTEDELQGKFKLISMAGKLFSKMNTQKTVTTNPGTTYKYCSIFPEGVEETDCEISGSYDQSRGDPDSPYYNQKSAHLAGLAIDINCQGSRSSEPTRCTGKTSKMLNAIVSANPGFNIIEECNVTQSACNGNSGVQVIHLDLKDRGQEGCYMTDCTHSCL